MTKLTNRKFALRIVATLVLIASLACAPGAIAGNTLSFPPTDFAIVEPTTHLGMGRGHYSIAATPLGPVVHGENRYDSGASDVELAHLQSGPAGESPRLIDFDHTFYKIDGSILLRSHLDLKTGYGTCIDNMSDPKLEQTDPLAIPPDTWAGASVAIPIQHMLHDGATGSQPLHVFNCAPTPKIFAIQVNIDPAAKLWEPYGDALMVEVRPDFGWINILIAPFVPKLHAWFDPHDDWTFVGSESARYYKGPPIMLVKMRDAPTAQAKH